MPGVRLKSSEKQSKTQGEREKAAGRQVDFMSCPCPCRCLRKKTEQSESESGAANLLVSCHLLPVLSAFELNLIEHLTYESDLAYLYFVFKHSNNR